MATKFLKDVSDPNNTVALESLGKIKWKHLTKFTLGERSTLVYQPIASLPVTYTNSHSISFMLFCLQQIQIHIIPAFGSQFYFPINFCHCEFFPKATSSPRSCYSFAVNTQLPCLPLKWLPHCPRQGAMLPLPAGRSTMKAAEEMF